jgi:hypothetical protein
MASADLLIERGVAERQKALIRMNIGWLRQALDLLVVIGDESFATTPEGMAPHRVSGHLRHIIEFYECFLDGLVCSHVDYDARQRDATIERSRQAAMARIRGLMARLETEPVLMGDSILFVRAEDAAAMAWRWRRALVLRLRRCRTRGGGRRAPRRRDVHDELVARRRWLSASLQSR